MIRKNRDRRFSEINAIPLIDVLLVLLVIFMVTAPLYLQEIQLELPTVDAKQNASEPKPQDITLYIEKDGHMYLSEKKDKTQKTDQIINQLKQITQKKQRDIYVQADKNCAYGIVIGVLSAIEKNGFSHFHLVNTSEN